jgi:hypothetical protein
LLLDTAKLRVYHPVLQCNVEIAKDRKNLFLSVANLVLCWAPVY